MDATHPPGPADPPEATTAADRRWDQSVRVALGHPSPAALEQGRRARLRRRQTLLIVFVVCLALGVGTQLVLGGSDHQPDPSAVRENAGLAVSAVSVALVITGLVIILRTRQWRVTSPLTSLDRTQRQQVMRQLRGRQELDATHPERVAVPLDVASRMARPWGLVVIICGVAVNFFAQLVSGSGSPWIHSALGVAGVCMLAALVLILRDQRSAQRFLKRHAPRAAEGT